MEILPAIDLLSGKCVRLVQGRYDRVIEYERDLVEVVEDFVDAGAAWLHVIDLQGARGGTPQNLDALKRIADLGAQFEFGGGVRDEDSIQAALDAGAGRVIIGTRALEDWNWFKSVVHQDRFMNKLSLGLDARLGKLATHGWTRDTEKSATDLAKEVAPWPLATICYTDIGRDGMLLGPNVDAIRDLCEVSAVPVIASGGVTELEDVRRLAQLNLEGVVIGRAIYEESISLRDAIAAAHRKDDGR